MKPRKAQPLLERIESKGRRMRALIRSLDRARLGVSGRQLCAIVDYLQILALELSDGAAGQPSVTTLMTRLGWCRRKVQIVRAQTARLGLVRFVSQTCEHTGRTRSSRQEIAWDTIHACGVSQGKLYVSDRAQGGACCAPGGALDAPLRRISNEKVLQTLPPSSPVGSWQSIADRIASLGVGEWEKIVKSLQARVDVEHVDAILNWYEANSAAKGYGVGALVLRLRRATPALAIKAGWPTPTERPETPAKASPKSEDPEAMRYRYRKHLLDQGIHGDALVQAMNSFNR